MKDFCMEQEATGGTTHSVLKIWSCLMPPTTFFFAVGTDGYTDQAIAAHTSQMREAYSDGNIWFHYTR